MSISVIPGPEESAEDKQIREELANWDVNKFPWLEESIPLCECCLKGFHLPEQCSYREVVPEGETVGPGFRLCCKWCFEEEFHPDELQTCVNCASTTKKAVENECDVCGEYRGHLEKDCELAEFVDWDALDKLGLVLVLPPYLVGDALDEALRRKAMRDGAQGSTDGKAT